MTKVLLLVPHIDLGGGARRIKAYVDHLPSLGYQVEIAVWGNTIVRDTKMLFGATPLQKFTNTQELCEFLKREQFSVVYTFYDGQYHPFLFSVFHFCHSNGISVIANNVFAYYDQRMDDLCDRVVFQTEMMLWEKFRPRVPPKKWSYTKYRLLRNPVSVAYLQSFALSKKERLAARSKLGFRATDFVVGRFGRADIVKWGDILLATMFHVRADARIRFCITGMPTSRRFLLQMLGVFFPSLRTSVVVLAPTANDKELMRRMQCVDAVGHSVRIGEGCSNAINEALFWGKPVLTNSTPHCDNGQCEQVQDGVNGAVANTWWNWARILKQWSQDSDMVLRLGEQGKKKAVSLYSDVTVAHELALLLREVGESKSISHHFEEHAKKSYTSYHVWYQTFLKNHPLPNRSIWQYGIDQGVRVMNYLEYRMQHG